MSVIFFLTPTHPWPHKLGTWKNLEKLKLKISSQKYKPHLQLMVYTMGHRQGSWFGESGVEVTKCRDGPRGVLTVRKRNYES